MNRARATLTVGFFVAAVALACEAQQDSDVEVFSGTMSYHGKSDVVQFTNAVVLKWHGSVLSANSISVNQRTGDSVAEGNVRIQQEDLLWTGDYVQYNFKTRQMIAERFRTGRSPVFAQGHRLKGDTTNQVYDAYSAFVTTDDVADPLVKIRAHHIRIVPEKYIEATHAVLYVGDVPAFYFPYYHRNLGANANNFNFIPGYRSRYGPFLLGDYTWFLNEELDGKIHFDYREKRGVGTGPDLNFHLGRWGDGSFRYYYAHDEDAGTNISGVQLPEDRKRLDLSYQATPFTNLNVKSVVRYQNDSDVVKEFFPGEYRQDPQPDTFVEVNKFWQNFSLDVLAHPQINNFLETVERLPDVRLSGFRQQLAESPFYYESESSAGYYKRLFAGTNSPFPSSTNTSFSAPNQIPPNFSAARADTYHQITLPETFFGWLNVTPRVGGRLTYYSAVDVEGSGTTFRTNSDTYRGVFNTGAEVSFKASGLWPGVRNKVLDLDGVRHIIEPSINYVFVPKPNATPNQLPQFDAELPTLRLQPIEYPEYNSIDSIDSQNVLRFGLDNRLQTKRRGQLEDFLNWQLVTDWRLRPRQGQSTFADIYSDLVVRPRSWMSLQSQTRFDIQTEQWRLSFHTLTLEPNETWSWTIGHFYLRDDPSSSPLSLGEGNNLITTSLFYRLNENWGLRTALHFDARNGRLQEQYYTVYRDMRSWTAALTAGVLDNGTGPKDFTIAFTFSVKARPKFGLGSDSVRPYSLLGQ
ncbi:MAG TPA: LPS assembly protein LptD [Verrucomicrobiae bacterium]|nr:LPS assembly protein LptD [Verrucomicrobiae bacterium]